MPGVRLFVVVPVGEYVTFVLMELVCHDDEQVASDGVSARSTIYTERGAGVIGCGSEDVVGVDRCKEKNGDGDGKQFFNEHVCMNQQGEG